MWASSPSSPLPSVVVIPRRSSSAHEYLRSLASLTVVPTTRNSCHHATRASAFHAMGKLSPLLTAESDTDDSDGPATPTTPVMRHLSFDSIYFNVALAAIPSDCLSTPMTTPTVGHTSPPPHFSAAPPPSAVFTDPFRTNKSGTDATGPVAVLNKPRLAPSPASVTPLLQFAPDPLSLIAAGYAPSTALAVTDLDSSVTGILRSSSHASTVILPPTSPLADACLCLPTDDDDGILPCMDASSALSGTITIHTSDTTTGFVMVTSASSRSAEQKDAAKDAVLAALSDVVQVQPESSSSPQPHAGAACSARVNYSAGSSPLNPASQLDSSSVPPALPRKDPVDVGSGSGSGAAASNKPKSFGGRFSQVFKKHGEEKENKRKAKEVRMREEINKSSQKLSRMDIIDRLDASAINGFSMFHHDSPYDAVSEHRNKNSKRAPVMAFDPSIDPMTGQPWKHGQGPSALRNSNGSSRTGPSPPTESKLAHMDSADDHNDGAAGVSNGNVPALSMYDSTASATAFVSPSLADHPDHNADAERNWRNEQGYWTQPSNLPSSRYDVSNPNADIWGVSAEPWQDFANPKPRPPSSSALSPHVGGSASARLSTDNRSGVDSSASSVLDMEAIMTGNTSKNRRPSPSPAGPDAMGGVSPFPEPNWGDAVPKRSKSLIKRIRSVRQSPKVPMLDDQANDRPPPPLASRRNKGAGGLGHKYSSSSPSLTRAVPDSTPTDTHPLPPPGADGNSADRSDLIAQASSFALDTDLRVNAGAAGVGATYGGQQAQTSGKSSNVGRNGSLFNRFGRQKSKSPVPE
ncbi:hypothetical protein K437DRAFT_32827 [Tilletiaria anomala UBC 951]|uniref:Pal1-domain-containing protein n=1 Tax=Tilletiaria anomala (strain ATCC 24038 / CBS 436.72 / UBC 951) TaxID=1037660 RepID=A0A066WDW0_TILAU|nr:uncharacterized protein K437DRAFT_32827 [Tilletiaria anomala UBC 951]KDN52142.1 hypothetical protein K437DRAFT_32827 [Tilletiaria anomala UBC 951]